MLLFSILQRLFGLVSLAVLASGATFAWSWWEHEHQAELGGLDDPSNARLYWAIGLLALVFLGRFLVLALTARSGPGADAGQATTSTVEGADGSSLNVRTGGAAIGPVLMFTHGWGMSSRIWGQAERALGDRFGTVTWDLPGAGRSGRSRAAWSIEGFAEDLHAVIDSLPADRPVVLVGHSIGGMTSQTLCAHHPELLHRRIVGLVLENTTHLNPLHTMILSGPLSALEPVLRVTMRLTILLSPLLWLVNWLNYVSGSTHLAMRIAGFGDRPTRATLDLASLLPTRTSPAVQAHGNLAMFDWSVSDRLPAITVPTLVFVGGRDLVTKDHAGETIAKAIGSAQLVRVETAGHMGPFEHPQDYNDAIAAFVTELPQAPATRLSPMSFGIPAAGVVQ